MLNNITLIGRLTKTPEHNEAVSVVNFDLAVDNVMLEKDGTRGTTFVPCKAFNKVAEIIVQYCDKGQKLGISGRLQQRNFTRKDGSKGSVLEVIVDSIELLEPKQVEEPVVEDEPLYDPHTGKPLKQKAK